MKSLKNPTFAFRPAQTQQNTNEMIILQPLSCFLSTTGLWRRSYASGYLCKLQGQTLGKYDEVIIYRN